MITESTKTRFAVEQEGDSTLPELEVFVKNGSVEIGVCDGFISHVITMTREDVRALAHYLLESISAGEPV